MTEETAVERFRDWVRVEIDGKSSFKIPDIVSSAEKTFGEDASFLRSFARDTLRARFYKEVQGVVAEARRGLVRVGGTFVSAEKVGEAATSASRAVWGRWERCFEHVGGKHMLVLDMNAKDLTTAETERFEAAEQHARWARFFAEIRKGVKRGKKVRDCFTAADLNDIWNRVAGEATEEKGAA